MAFLKGLLRRERVPAAPAPPAEAPPVWAQSLFAEPLAVERLGPAGEPLVWAVPDKASSATITDQFKAGAEEYNRRYAASDHFEALFRQALDATGVTVAERPLILDLGSGSGANSVVPCRRLFPGARAIATDLSGELLAMLAHYALAGGGGADEIVCVKMDAMSGKVAPGAFDLVTGAAILHHLDSPQEGLSAAARALKPGGHAIFFEPFNGWSIMRLAAERILAEAGLRGEALDPAVSAPLTQLVDDIAGRSAEAWSPDRAAKDDKWLFSRTGMERMAQAAGFSQVRFVPHNDHPTLFRDTAGVYMRLASGRDDLTLPAWANAVLDGFDAAMTLNAKRELMLEGSIVLTKAG